MKASAIAISFCILFAPMITGCPSQCDCSSNMENVTVLCMSIELHRIQLPTNATHLLLKQLPEKPQSDNGQGLFLDFSYVPEARVILLDADFMGYLRTYRIGPHSFADNSSITKFASRLPLTMDPDAIAPLKHLEELTLSTTAIKWEEFPAIMTQSLCDKNKLKRLVLHHFSREYGSSPFQSMFKLEQVFSHCRLPSLQELDLSGNDIFRLTGSIHKAFPNLRVLDLSHNMLTTTNYFWYGNHFMVLLDFLFFMNLHTVDLGSQMDKKMIESEWDKEDLFSDHKIPSPTLKCNISHNEYVLLKILRDPYRYGFFLYNKELCISIERLVIRDIIHNLNSWNMMAVEGEIWAPMNNLRYVDVSGNKLRWFYADKIQLMGLNDMEYINAQGLGLQSPNLLPVDQLPSLQYFLLGNNRLGSFFLSNTTYSFKQLKCLKVLDLANNGISSVPSGIVTDCLQLTHMNLSGNHMVHVNIDLNDTIDLQVLNLSNNLIENLPASMKQNLDQLASAQETPLILDLDKNPLSCGCHDISFISWLQTTRVDIHSLDTLTCFHPFYGTTAVRKIDVDELYVQCFPSNLKTIVVSVSVTIGVIFSFAVPLLIYCKRWKMRYWWYITNSSWRRIRQEQDLTSYEYDAFVACHHSDLQWVKHHLLVQMEDIRNFRFCVYHRDFIQGRNTAEEIAEGIHSSKYTILVLSPKFVESEWCHFEINMALNQLFDSGRDVILPVILKPLLSTSINRTLYGILKKKLYNEWDDEDFDAQKLFWCKLNEALTR